MPIKLQTNTPTILIIGGCGFIGSNLTLTFLKQDWNVIVLDPAPWPFNIPFSRLTHFQGTLENRTIVKEVFKKKPNVILHAYSGFKGTSDFEATIHDLHSNVEPSVFLMSQTLLNRSSQFVFISSGGAIYGQSKRLPIRETYPLAPISDYGQSKRIFESYIEYYSSKGLDSLVFRPGNIYGPHQMSSSNLGLINELLKGIIEDRPIPVFGNGIRDYLHVEDFCRGVFMAINQKLNGVFNIGTGTGSSIEQIIDLIKETTGVAPKVDKQPARKGDVLSNILNVDKLKNALEWQPQINLKSGINELWRKKSANESSGHPFCNQ
jgi:UDP-glucose 4-epimerase